MRRLLGLIVSLGVAMVVLTSALAFSQAQQVSSVTATFIPLEEKKAEAAQKDNTKAKITEKDEAPKKDEVKRGEARKQAVRAEAVQIQIMNRRVAVPPGEPDPQVLQQYRPMLWAEYLLARSVCDLAPEQRKAIARDAEHAFQEAVAKSGRNGNRGRMIVRGPNGVLAVNQQRLEPDDSIREGLAKAVRDHLKPEQAAKYQEELDKRAAHRRRIAADNITAKIDESLILTVAQRDKIRGALVANWKESWCPTPEALLMNGQIMPQIPDEYVVPFLNEAQKTIWRGLNKFSGVNFRSFGFMADNMQGADSPEDDALREAREAETKAREEARAKKEAAEKKGAEAKKANPAKAK